MAFASRGFLDEPEFADFTDELASGHERAVQFLGEKAEGEDGHLEKEIEEALRQRGLDAGLVEGQAPLFAEVENFPGGGRGALADLEDSAEEEFHPSFPVTAFADGSETLVVFRAVAFEIVAQIEERALEDLALAEKECDEEAANAAVSVQKGMDGLELGVGQSAEDERRHGGLPVQECFKIGKGLHHFGHRGRGEGGGLERATLRANPVLRTAEFPGRLVTPPHAGHQLAVDFTDEPQAEGQLGKASEPVVHGGDVVHHFLNILGLFRGLPLGFELQDIFKGALRALDLGTEHGFVAHVHGHEEIGIRKDGADTIEPTQCPICLGKQVVQLVIPDQGGIWRERRRHKGGVSRRLFYKSPCS